jgi:hypothetical protein
MPATSTPRPTSYTRAGAFDFDAEADLRGVGAADAGLRSARTLGQLRERVLELRRRRLERRGVDVGDVVAGDVEHGLV